jgi:tetratricopeptide (TPR) repeat protein
MKINRKMLEILLDLHRKKRSGILRIQKDADKKQLVLHNGLLVLAESNMPQEHLAWIMVTLNLLPRTKLNDIASSMKTGKTSEEALIELFGSTFVDIERGRREQALTIISSILVWEDCDFRFYAGEDLVRYRLNLGIQLPELIVSSVRQAVEMHLLNAPSRFIGRTFKVTEDSATLGLPLNQAESNIYSLLHTPTKAADLLRVIPATMPKPEEVLLFLYFLGLIAFHADQAAADPTAARVKTGVDPVVERLEELLHRLDSASLYEILSVEADASQENIQAAYHEQARQLHPDRFQTGEYSADIRGKAQQVFARINQAYMTLKNPASRVSYDEQWAKQRASAAGPKPGADQSAETAEALFREGRSLLAQGDVKTAVERLKGSVWLCPDKAAYNYHLGMAESRIPKLRKSAEQHLLKAIELEDSSPDSHLALAKLYMDVHLPRKAELHLKQVLGWDQENAEARNLLAGLKKAR